MSRPTHEPIDASTTGRRTVLLVSPSWTASEARIWIDVGNSLQSRGLEFVLARYDTGDGDQFMQSFYPWRLHEFKTINSKMEQPSWISAEQISKLVDRERLWTSAEIDEVGAAEAIINAYTVIASLLCTLRPNLVVLWNGELTLNLIARHLVEMSGGHYLFAERTPFPGVIYIDEEGQMSESSFAKQPTSWSSDAQRSEAVKRFSDYQDLLTSKSITWYQPKEQKSCDREELGIPAGKKVILFAGQLDADTQNFLASPFFETNLEAFQSFCRHVRESSDDYFILGKHHPLCSAPIEDFQQVVGDMGMWCEDIALSAAINISDLVAAVNSSVLFEASAAGKPCLAMGKTLLSGQNIFYEFRSADDQETVTKWLAKDEFETRQAAWLDRCAWLFAKHFFPSNELHVENLEESRSLVLADRLCQITENSSVTYFPIQHIAARVSTQLLMACRTCKSMATRNAHLNQELHRLRHENDELQRKLEKRSTLADSFRKLFSAAEPDHPAA